MLCKKKLFYFILLLCFISIPKVFASTSIQYSSWQMVYEDNSYNEWDNSYIYRLGQAKNLKAISVFYPRFSGYFSGYVTISADPVQFPNNSLFLDNTYFTLYVKQNGSWTSANTSSIICSGAGMMCTYRFNSTVYQQDTEGVIIQLLMNPNAYIFYPAFKVSSFIDYEGTPSSTGGSNSGGISGSEFNSGINNIISNDNSNTQSIIDNQDSNTQSINDTINNNFQTCDNENTVLFNYDSTVINGISYSQYPSCLTNDSGICYNTKQSISSTGSVDNVSLSAQVVINNIPIKDKSVINVHTESLNNSGSSKTYYYNLLDDNKTVISTGSFTLPGRSWTSTNVYDFVINNSNASYLQFNFYQNTQSMNDYKLYPKVNISVVGTGCRNKLDDINGNMEDINNTLNDDSSPDTSGFIQSITGMLPTDTPITTLLSMPIILINRFLDSMNGTCQSFSLGTLYGHELVMPCINPVDYFGQNVWNLIDGLFCIFMIYNIAMLCITIYESITNLDDTMAGLYDPRHAYTGYQPKHGG